MQYLLELNNQKYKNLENIHPVYSYLSFNDNLSTPDLYEKFEKQVNNALNVYVRNKTNEFVNRWLYTINLTTISNDTAKEHLFENVNKLNAEQLTVNKLTPKQSHTTLASTIGTSIFNTYQKSLRSVMNELDINHDTQEKFQNILAKIINKLCNTDSKSSPHVNITNLILQNDTQKLGKLITCSSNSAFIKENFKLDFDSFTLDKDDVVAILNEYFEKFTDFKPEPIMKIVPYPYKEY